MTSGKFKAIHHTELNKIILRSGYENFNPDSMSSDEYNQQCSDLLQQNTEKFDGISEIVFHNHVKKVYKDLLKLKTKQPGILI